MRDVLFRDFEVVETVDFPRSGTKTTQAHGLSDFRFRTFAPVAFRSFRDHFLLDIRDYLVSFYRFNSLNSVVCKKTSGVHMGISIWSLLIPVISLSLYVIYSKASPNRRDNVYILFWCNCLAHSAGLII